MITNIIIIITSSIIIVIAHVEDALWFGRVVGAGFCRYRHCPCSLGSPETKTCSQNPGFQTPGMRIIRLIREQLLGVLLHLLFPSGVHAY